MKLCCANDLRRLRSQNIFRKSVMPGEVANFMNLRAIGGGTVDILRKISDNLTKYGDYPNVVASRQNDIYPNRFDNIMRYYHANYGPGIPPGVGAAIPTPGSQPSLLISDATAESLRIQLRRSRLKCAVVIVPESAEIRWLFGGAGHMRVVSLNFFDMCGAFPVFHMMVFHHPR